MKWHEANQAWLVNRRPLATVGVVWSQINTDFYGQDRASELMDAAYRGFTAPGWRADTLFADSHRSHRARRQESQSADLAEPGCDIGREVRSDRKYVANGGALIATAVTSVCTEFGDARKDYGLADLFGAHSGDLPTESGL